MHSVAKTAHTLLRLLLDTSAVARGADFALLYKVRVIAVCIP